MEKYYVNYEQAVAFDIDAMNGFTPNCPNELPVEGGDKIVSECLQNHTKAKFKIMSKDTHPPDAEWNASKEKPIFSEVGLPNVDIRWPSHCVVGTYGFKLLAGLPHPSEYNFLVYKGAESDMHPYSPIFHDLKKTISTGVIEWATVNKIKTFILGGLALDFCLGEGAKDLNNAGFGVIINLGATRGIAEIKKLKELISEMKEAGIKFIDDASEIENI